MTGSWSREAWQRDVPAVTLFVGHLRGRTLPVGSARFAMQIASVLMRPEMALAEARPGSP